MSAESCPIELLHLAGELADVAGRVHGHYFRRPLAVEIKADASPVSVSDREAEHAVRERLRRAYPDHGIVGEELPPERPDADWLWIIDPLDGTKLFLSGMPWFAVLLGLAHRGRFVLGVVDFPLLRERWMGADGHGAARNGEPVHTRGCDALQHAILCRPGVGDGTLGRDDVIDRACAGARWVHWGANAYHVGLLASGFVDGIVTAGPKLHDLAPLDPILRNAGGVVSDWQGRPLDLQSGSLLVAAGDPALHGRLLQGLRR